MNETKSQRDLDLYIINSNFQRYFWSHYYLLCLPLNSGDLTAPINSLISKIFNFSQVACFYYYGFTGPSKHGYNHVGWLSVINFAKQIPTCSAMGRHGIAERITSCEIYFISSKHTLRRQTIGQYIILRGSACHLTGYRCSKNVSWINNTVNKPSTMTLVAIFFNLLSSSLMMDII